MPEYVRRVEDAALELFLLLRKTESENATTTRHHCRTRGRPPLPKPNAVHMAVHRGQLPSPYVAVEQTSLTERMLPLSYIR